MRIVSGKFKGMEIISPPRNLELRPTSDRVREAIFDVIRFDITDKVFLDLFAGSGAVGIEAVSEGAKFVYFVENNKKAVDVIKKNIAKFGIREQCKILVRDVFKFLSDPQLEREVDFIFLDPPYKTHFASETLETLKNSSIVKKGSIIIAEHSEEEFLSEAYVGKVLLSKFKEKRYGKIVVSYFIRA
ncbi:16S rRNA (guanine(966)-N(2))-methyltransferase RsmD [Caldisericum exile]|uniref:Methyltransferase n=1 Tax=Caldisericum exile (strain DSM 21853 / NBRC 104410 / AZM16c01) TaxID=511051 RepID=A0A7U6JEX2_CALEA|nr:16S rRNA (guanine(966)-N(2))-methyltransferase RsmD [Caldisericum exile]BAL80898.1 putative methyltransferase [Caldisericum exile AZM16c01]